MQGFGIYICREAHIQHINIMVNRPHNSFYNTADRRFIFLSKYPQGIQFCIWIDAHDSLSIQLRSNDTCHSGSMSGIILIGNNNIVICFNKVKMICHTNFIRCKDTRIQNPNFYLILFYYHTLGFLLWIHSNCRNVPLCFFFWSLYLFDL